MRRAGRPAVPTGRFVPGTHGVAHRQGRSRPGVRRSWRRLAHSTTTTLETSPCIFPEPFPRRARPRRPFPAAAAAALAATALLTACGGGGSSTLADGAPKLRFTIAATEDFPGSYGSVGAYEKVSGTVQGEIDPADPRNAVIQDLQLAPRNSRGMVEYSADFVLLKPKDMSKAGGVLRYDAPNRGNIPHAAQSGGRAGRRGVFRAGLYLSLFRMAGRRAQEFARAAHGHRARGPQCRRQQHHRPVPHGAGAHRRGRGHGAARRRLQWHHDSLRARGTGQHAAGLFAHAPPQRDRSARSHTGCGLEVRRLRYRGQPVPRHAQPRQCLPARRVRSAVSVRTGLCGQGSEGHGRGARCAARYRGLFPRQGRRRGRPGQSAGGPHHARDRTGHVPVGQCDEDLPAPGFQPAAGWGHGVRRHLRPCGGAADQREHPLRRARRRWWPAHRPYGLRADGAARPGGGLRGCGERPRGAG